MCGICGYSGIGDEALLTKMTDSLSHRGPDDHGYYRHGTVGLGHRRLSVIDIAGGHQPMVSDDGNLVLIFNGEIYNYRELRETLEHGGRRFTTASDTEVLLALYEERGAAALTELNGMFAFAVFDRRDGSLFLARDRIGIKPLYYLSLPGRFLFASEAKSILCYRDWSPTLNVRAVHDYLALRYVPGDRGMYRELRKLPAGHYLTYRDGSLDIRPYWEPTVYEGPHRRGDEEYFDEFAELMDRSVKRRMISDVPVGAYLSGGLDSSTIVASMSRLTSKPVKTFSVGFDYEHDELNEAAATAKILGCDHHEIACRGEDVGLLAKIIHHLDEPMGDAIIIPMFQLSQAAKREVTVILTGEGGDEVLGGYLFHKLMWAGDVFRRTVPGAVRSALIAPLLAAMPVGAMNLAFKYPAYLGRRGKRKVLDYLKLLAPQRIDDAYRHLISLFDERDTQDLYTQDFRQELAEQSGHAGTLQTNGALRGAYFDRLLRLQFDHWLPDNMLLRQDRTGMAHGIEGRVPFLDHELVEFGARLPRRLKLRRMTGKYILRKYASGLLPREVAQRKKMPFYVPIENYFQQKEFRDLMDDLLNEESVRRRGLFRPEAVATLRAQTDRREFVRVKQVFSLMVLELWFRIFHDRCTP